MSSTNAVCEVCAQDSHQSTLVKSVTKDVEAVFCMRCFHALMHGMQVEQLRERWKDYQATCQH